MTALNRTRAGVLVGQMVLSVAIAYGESLSVPLPLAGIRAEKNAQDAAVFPDAALGGEVGHPALPRLCLKVLLPPNADPSSLNTRIVGEKTVLLLGTWDVEPVPRPVALQGGMNDETLATNRASRDAQAYSKNEFQPADHLLSCKPGQMREWRFLEVVVCIYRYNPVSKQLDRLEEGTLQVDFRCTADKRILRSRSRATADEVRKLIKQTAVNFEKMAHEYDNVRP